MNVVNPHLARAYNCTSESRLFNKTYQSESIFCWTSFFFLNVQNKWLQLNKIFIFSIYIRLNKQGMITFCFVLFQLTFSKCNRRPTNVFYIYTFERTISSIRANDQTVYMMWFSFSIVSIIYARGLLARHTTFRQGERWFKRLLAHVKPAYI